MTSTKPQEDLIPSPPLTWDMRVVNMDQIDYGGLSPSASPLIPQLINVSVSYVGNSVITLLIMFSLYLGIYVYYLSVTGQLSSPLTTALLIIPIGLWSLMSADVGETYLASPFESINHLINAPILALNFVALWWVVLRIYQKAKSAKASTYNQLLNRFAEYRPRITVTASLSPIIYSTVAPVTRGYGDSYGQLRLR
jgi:hypothetical protein